MLVATMHHYGNPGFTSRDDSTENGTPGATKHRAIGRRKERLRNSQRGARSGSTSSKKVAGDVVVIPTRFESNGDEGHSFVARDMNTFTSSTDHYRNRSGGSPPKQSYLSEAFLNGSTTNSQSVSSPNSLNGPVDQSTPTSPTRRETSSSNHLPALSSSALSGYSPTPLYSRRADYTSTNRSFPLLAGSENSTRQRRWDSDERGLSDSEAIEANLSTISSRDRFDANHSVVSHKSLDLKQHSPAWGLNGNKSLLSANSAEPNRMYSQMMGSLALSHEENLANIQTRTPTDKQNGILRSWSRQSLSMSKPSLNLSKANLCDQNLGVSQTVASLAYVGFISLVLAVIGLQLLFQLSEVTPAASVESGSLRNISHRNAAEVAVALASFVVMLNLCCMMTCTMQCFFVAKLLKVHQGQERAFQYLQECASIRFISVTGFFLSVPFLFTAVLLYLLMVWETTPAVISSVILCVGMLFVSGVLLHSTVRWRIHKSAADLDYTSDNRKAIKSNELSTLV